MSHQNHLVHQHINRKKRLNLFDKTAMVVACIYPATGIPQMVQVISGPSEGVSLVSWMGFIVFSLFFFIYGIVHAIKPIIVTNFLWIIVDSTVVIVVLIRQMM
jgi:hypothetical protein